MKKCSQCHRGRATRLMFIPANPAEFARPAEGIDRRGSDGSLDYWCNACVDLLVDQLTLGVDADEPAPT